MNKQLLKQIYKLKDTVSGGNRVILYINGSEILPKPLDPLMEAECLATLGKNPKSEQLLIEHNLMLVVFIAKKFETATAGLEDLISIGTISLSKSIHTFRTDKNIKLATYASRSKLEKKIIKSLRDKLSSNF